MARTVKESDLNFIYRPRSQSQKDAEELWKRSRILFFLGPAGTGKSLAALGMAIREAIQNAERETHNQRRLWLVRPAVPCGADELGFLPGDLDSKIGPWMAHFQDCFEALSTASWQKMEKTLQVSMLSLGLLRGRSFHQGTLICDEMQNASREQLKCVLTRLGEGSRIVVCADPDQSDRYDPKKSPVMEAARRLADLDMVSVLHFREQLRDPLVGEILDRL